MVSVTAMLSVMAWNTLAQRNNIRGKEQEISAEGSKVKIFVIPTNEEIMIARDTQRITSALKK